MHARPSLSSKRRLAREQFRFCCSWGSMARNGQCARPLSTILKRWMQRQCIWVRANCGWSLMTRLCPSPVLAPLPCRQARFSWFGITDGTNEVAYAVREVLDIHALTSELISPAAPGEIEGLALIDGEPVEIVDVHWLFQQHAGPEAPAAKPVCRLPADDPWMQNFLRTLVETAGYLVVDEHDPGVADLAFASPEISIASAQAHQVIWLRPHRAGVPDQPDSIYRYDRVGLVAALRTAQARK